MRTKGITDLESGGEKEKERESQSRRGVYYVDPLIVWW